MPNSVCDGDTFRATLQGEELRIRLAGIDAPELSQPLGKEARDRLRELLSDNIEVKIQPIDRDRYGRIVAEVWTEQFFINGAMSASGLVWIYEDYIGNCPSRNKIVFSAQFAKSRKLGIYGDDSAIAPWEWRRSQRFN